MKTKWIILTILTAILTVFFAEKTLHKHNLSQDLSETQRRLDVIRSLVLEAELVASKPVHQITKNSCSMCPCKTDNILFDTSYTNTCQYNWSNAIINIWRSIGRNDTPPDWLMTDPWGSPFLLNENVTGENCYNVIISSAGPDGLVETSDDITLHFMSSGCRDPQTSMVQTFVVEQSEKH